MEHYDWNDGWLFTPVFDPAIVRPECPELTLEPVRLPHTVKALPYNYCNENDYQKLSGYRPFEAAMQDVKAAFGLTLPTDPDAANAGKLLLTDYEVQNLRTAYDRTLEVGSASQKDMTQQDYELYGTYIPFSMAICHTINHKSGMDHTTYAHTGAMVNLYAMGVGAEKFGGVYDNTEVFHKLAELTSVQ